MLGFIFYGLKAPIWSLKKKAAKPHVCRRRRLKNNKDTHTHVKETGRPEPTPDRLLNLDALPSAELEHVCACACLCVCVCVCVCGPERGKNQCFQLGSGSLWRWLSALSYPMCFYYWCKLNLSRGFPLFIFIFIWMLVSVPLAEPSWMLLLWRSDGKTCHKVGKVCLSGAVSLIQWFSTFF